MIHTQYRRLPIPVRGYDWCALETRPYRSGDPIGWGASKAEAVAHLKALQAERAENPVRWDPNRPWARSAG